jgi:Tfp pilus assembly protein PilO
MTQERFTSRKRSIFTVLGLLIAADIALGVYSWQLASAPYTSPKQFDAMSIRLDALRANIQSAQKIKDAMPQTKSDCDKFEQALPPESAGSSSMAAELDDIAKKAGLRVEGFSFKPKQLPDHGVTEESIEATVSGDYAAVARFVNALQRSQKFYIMDGLSVSGDSQTQKATGPLRVAVHLRTYFRMAA